MKLTWLGHAAFRIEITDAVILIDPFFTGNPKFPGDAAAAARGVTHIVLTHGHGDHVGDTVAIARDTGAKVIGDAEAPGPIAWATYAGHRFARELDEPDIGDALPFRREVTALAAD